MNQKSALQLEGALHSTKPRPLQLPAGTYTRISDMHRTWMITVIL